MNAGGRTFKLWMLPLLLCLAGCNSDSGTTTPGPQPPRVTDLAVNPEVICVGTAADVSFNVTDPNQDPVSWSARLSTQIHGILDKTEGTDPSGSHIQFRFKAATSGRHRHFVKLKVNAVDSGGLQAEEAEFEIYVFNCF
jgi:hypothetical protein